jgi:hypothetical protein
MNILTVNLLFSTLPFWIAARLYVVPKLAELPPRSVLPPILLLHGFRHLGLMVLEPGATYAGLPARFAYPAAYGDLLAAARREVLIGSWASDEPRGISTPKVQLLQVDAIGQVQRMRPAT